MILIGVQMDLSFITSMSQNISSLVSKTKQQDDFTGNAVSCLLNGLLDQTRFAAEGHASL